MNKLFSDFKKSSLEEWKNQFIKDLKGKDHGILEFNDEIEEIAFRAYYHSSELSCKGQQPGNYPYTRGNSQPENNWENAQMIEIKDEKIANNHALKLLMEGVDSIYFKSIKEATDWSMVLSDIQVEHITVCFEISSTDEYLSIISLAPVFKSRNVSFAYDLISNGNINDAAVFAEHLKQNQQAVFIINGFGIQQSGGSISQEIGFSINAGHEVLLQLMENGLTIDEAAACIHFNVGIGSNYFNEIAKLRALRTLWAKMIAAYKPEHNCTHSMSMTATIGLSNKSLKDPHTNLLRQTTEAMSAVSGGANKILILPYDSNSTKGMSDLAQRMAINISLILKEESYFDKVIDPAGGSYSVEHLTTFFEEKGWSYFQSLEKLGGLLNIAARTHLFDSVAQTVIKRTNAIAESKMTLIGINKYYNIENVDNDWKTETHYMGMPFIIFEKLAKQAVHESN